MSPSSRHRSDEAKAEVRAAMTDAAARLLVAHGYDGLTLAAVAREVGFTTTNIYRYFDSKADLVYAAVEDGFVRFGEMLERAWRSSNDPIERIVALGRAYVAFARSHPVHYEMMFVDRSDYGFGERPVPGLDKLGYIVRAVEEGQRAGAVRSGDPLAMGHALWGLLHGVLMLGSAMPFIDETQLDADLEEAFRFMRTSLIRE